MADITSTQNSKVKKWKKLHTKRERNKTKTYIIEGFHLVEEAINFNKENILHILITEELMDSEEMNALDLKNLDIISITSNVADELAETETNQGIFAILNIKENTSFSEIKAPFLMFDAVQDPGNVGTMIRTADAAGFQGVIFGEGTVDLYNAKTIRSAQGSHFHLEVFEGTLEDYIYHFKVQGAKVFGTALNEEAESYKNIDITGPFALIVGNEGAGMHKEILELVDQNIYIPMKGQSESLNVAIAASIMMFHLY